MPDNTEHQTSMPWTTVRVTPGDASEASRTACLAGLFKAGAQGVHEDGSALVTHFPPGTNLEFVHTSITELDESAVIETAPLSNIDWTERWKAAIGAHELGQLTVVPPWLSQGRSAEHTIVIEPGMAFGTGEHATTRGVVRLLQKHLGKDQSVADLGAGSAVLAIAAAKLGASRVFAIELDEDAIPNAELNVSANNVADRVHVFHADAATLLPLVAPVDVVLANIISSVLVELLPVIGLSLAPGGRIILSGILREERDAMCEALASHGWQVLEEDSEDAWWSVAAAQA